MTTRKAIYRTEGIRIALKQGVVVCPLCGKRISAGDGFDIDHAHPVALGGPDDITNWQLVHRACHKRKTNGSKATSYGSDKHAIAKTKRLAAGGKKRKGRKIQSRGFQKKGERR